MKYTFKEYFSDLRLLTEEVIGWQIIFIEMFVGSVLPPTETQEAE